MLLSALVLAASQASIVSAVPRLVGRANTPTAFASSNDGKYSLDSYTAPVSGAGNQGDISSTWKLTLDDSSSGHKQTIDGFGAAITDATVASLNALSDADRASALKEIFSSDGANFSFMRHTIGSSDLSPNLYTYDDTRDDNSLSSFRLGDSGNAMLNLLKEIKGVNSALKLLGSPWSPPGWLKLNGVESGQTYNNNLDLSKADTLAQYFVKYIQAFRAGGISVDAITVQNEPLNSQEGYPTTYVSSDDETNVIQNHLGPALKNAGLNTEIWAYDHNLDHPEYPQAVINNAGSYVNTAAWHCYATNNDWTVMTKFHNTNPNGKQFMTECWTSPQTSWSQAIDFTMGPLQNWGTGAMAWTLGTDTNYGPHYSGGCSTCRGLVEVDTGAKTYSFTRDFYFMGQFSKFLPRGATVLSTTGSYDYGSGNKIEAVGALNPDGTRTMVVWNGFNNPIYLTLTTKSGETWSGPLYQQSVITWVLPAAP